MAHLISGAHLLRAIVPIFIEDEDIIIRNYNELLAYMNQNKHGYALLHHSGLAQRLCFAFRKDVPNPTEQLQHEAHQDPFTLTNNHHLLALTYQVNAGIVHQPLQLLGIHRHQTMLEGQGQILLLQKDLELTFTTLSKMHIVISDGATLALRHTITDRVYITIQNGGKLQFEDVEMTGCHTPAIRVERGGIIEQCQRVVFFDVRHRFYLQYAQQHCIGKILDLSDADAIIEFLEHSVIEHAELIGDFRPSRATARFTQELNFHNPDPAPLRVVFKRVEFAASFKLHGEFITQGDVYSENIEEMELSLGHYEGIMKIHQINDLQIDRTYFQDPTLKIDLFRSHVTLTNSSFNQLDSPITLDQSIFTMKKTSVANTHNVFSVLQREISSDDYLMDSKQLPTRIEMEECSFHNINQILDSGLVESVHMRKTSFSYTENAFGISAGKLQFEHCPFNRNIDILKIKGGLAEFNDCEVHDDKKALVELGITLQRAILIEGGARVKLNETTLEHFQTGIHVLDGVVETRHSKIRNNSRGIVVEGPRAKLEHYQTEFIHGSKMRPLVVIDGATVMDLKEKEDMAQWHSA